LRTEEQSDAGPLRQGECGAIDLVIGARRRTLSGDEILVRARSIVAHPLCAA
jgi:hypothetical protein